MNHSDIRENLNTVCLEQRAAILSNAIMDCMMKNGMTLENLDDACTNVREVFRTNATMKLAD